MHKEVNRLEAENRSLRTQDMEASKQVDLELESGTQRNCKVSNIY